MLYVLFSLDEKRTKKIKAVFKSSDFAENSGSAKKTRCSCVALTQFFASSASIFAKPGFE